LHDRVCDDRHALAPTQAPPSAIKNGSEVRTVPSASADSPRPQIVQPRPRASDDIGQIELG